MTLVTGRDTLLHRFVEPHPHANMRLGRHLELDGRSLDYLTEHERELTGVQIKPAEYPCPLPILNQGNVGACVGFSATEGAAALYGPDYPKISLDNTFALTGDEGTDDRFALDLYHDCTLADGFPGTYPPDDTGSSGLGACKALLQAKIIARYTWATSLHALGVGFARAGFLIGMPWLNAFFQPDAHGFIDSDPRWAQSGKAGGHELYIEALETWDDRDPTKVVLRLRNHWTATWGDHGYGRMRGSTYLALQRSIDLKQLVR